MYDNAKSRKEISLWLKDKVEVYLLKREKKI